MKKLLGIIGSFGLVTTAGMSVMACQTRHFEEIEYNLGDGLVVIKGQTSNIQRNINHKKIIETEANLYAEGNAYIKFKINDESFQISYAYTITTPIINSRTMETYVKEMYQHLDSMLYWHNEYLTNKKHPTQWLQIARTTFSEHRWLTTFSSNMTHNNQIIEEYNYSTMEDK